MTRAAFERLVNEGVEQIPERFRGYLQDVALVVEGEPTVDQQHSSEVPGDKELLGLYEGTPRTERAYLSYRLPDKITLFQGPLERYCEGDTGCIRAEVIRTVEHELAHALGMPEDRVLELEARRGWTLETF